jgi:hypothetical protein
MSQEAENISESNLSGLMQSDTTFVLFFLAIEYGRNLQLFSLDGAVMGTTMLMVMVLPYFLRSSTARASFGFWLTGRTVISLFGMLFGLVLSYSTGSILPNAVAYLPLMFLILAAVISCYVQFYTLLKLRPVK